MIFKNEKVGIPSRLAACSLTALLSSSQDVFDGMLSVGAPETRCDRHLNEWIAHLNTVVHKITGLREISGQGVKVAMTQFGIYFHLLSPDSKFTREMMTHRSHNK
jgi:hypothetical protein